MTCNDNFRHVCLKDLENYIKRDEYFSDFSEEEIKLIQKNLGIVTSEPEYNPTLIFGDYTAIYNQMLASNLRVGYIYVIQDFRSLYTDIEGKVCGTDDFMPSQEYLMFLTPNSTNSFDKRVKLLKTNSTCSNWLVEYDITPVTLANGVTSKGTITFLKDTNNNYAYYDFKNIKFKKKASELSKGPMSYLADAYLYTFDNGGKDASETICKNNRLEYGAIRNVFMGNTQNTTLSADCHDNMFFRNCENSTFDFGTYNNYFKDNVIRCKGTVHDKELDSITSNNCPKQFDILEDKQVMVYLDAETQTYQIKKL